MLLTIQDDHFIAEREAVRRSAALIDPKQASRLAFYRDPRQSRAKLGNSRGGSIALFLRRLHIARELVRWASSFLVPRITLSEAFRTLPIRGWERFSILRYWHGNGIKTDEFTLLPSRIDDELIGGQITRTYWGRRNA
jgi:hypothetical protein